MAHVLNVGVGSRHRGFDICILDEHGTSPLSTSRACIRSSIKADDAIKLTKQRTSHDFVSCPEQRQPFRRHDAALALDEARSLAAVRSLMNQHRLIISTPSVEHSCRFVDLDSMNGQKQRISRL